MALFRSSLLLVRSLQTSGFHGEGLKNAAGFSLLGARRVVCHSFSCAALLGRSPPNISGLLSHKTSSFCKSMSWQSSSRLPCSGLLLVPCSCVHVQSGGTLAAKKPVEKKGSKGHEHGSVLMQFVTKKEEPKQVTVGAKGQQTWCSSSPFGLVRKVTSFPSPAQHFEMLVDDCTTASLSPVHYACHLQLCKLGRTWHTFWLSWAALCWQGSCSGLWVVSSSPPPVPLPSSPRHWRESRMTQGHVVCYEVNAWFKWLLWGFLYGVIFYLQFLGDEGDASPCTW